ncbi:hypothetical protein [Paraburkholderia diazotrophica]|nr:hypothetical protein [Paraburkholderia diazotrophica]
MKAKVGVCVAADIDRPASHGVWKEIGIALRELYQRNNDAQP